jgi:hypothetical protein
MKIPPKRHHSPDGGRLAPGSAPKYRIIEPSLRFGTNFSRFGGVNRLAGMRLSKGSAPELRACMATPSGRSLSGLGALGWGGLDLRLARIASRSHDC